MLQVERNVVGRDAAEAACWLASRAVVTRRRKGDLQQDPQIPPTNTPVLPSLLAKSDRGDDTTGQLAPPLAIDPSSCLKDSFRTRVDLKPSSQKLHAGLAGHDMRCWREEGLPYLRRDELEQLATRQMHIHGIGWWLAGHPVSYRQLNSGELGQLERR